MSQNIHQLFVSNPASSMQTTDLLYLGRSPYNSSDDFAITWANMLSSIPQVVTWVDQTTTSVTMNTNTGYTSDAGASLVTFTLPAASAIGDWIEINGKGSGLWTIAQATGQQIHINGVSTTSGSSGSLSSTSQYDAVRLRCLTANTIWEVVSMQSTGLTYV